MKPGGGVIDHFGDVSGMVERESRAKLEKLGVKIVTGVDKSGFEKVSKPIQDQLAKQLGPHAVKILELVRNVK